MCRSEKRLCPVLMTTLEAALGLLPAVVVIGGSLILADLNRAMQPRLLLFQRT